MEGKTTEKIIKIEKNVSILQKNVSILQKDVSVLQKDVAKVKQGLGDFRKETKQEIAKLATKDALNAVVDQVVKNSEDIEVLKVEMDKRPTRDEMNAGFDQVMKKLTHIEQEVISGFSRFGRMEPMVTQHDRDISRIKEHLQMA